MPRLAYTARAWSIILVVCLLRLFFLSFLFPWTCAVELWVRSACDFLVNVPLYVRSGS